MFTNPAPTNLVANTTVTVTPVTAQSQMVRPNQAILTNSSPFFLQVLAGTGVIQFLPPWTADLFTINPNNPQVVVTPTTQTPTSTPTDTSLYVTWVNEGEMPSDAYPQPIQSNVQQTVPPGVSKLDQAAWLLEEGAGTYPLVAGPGPGYSLYLNSAVMSYCYLGSSQTATGFIALEDGTGRVLTYVLGINESYNNLPVSFNGFEVGDNRALNFVVEPPSGATIIIATIALTYSIGITQ